MTNEEAKGFLLDLRAGCVSSYGTALYEERMAFVEALDLAIAALERDRWISVEERLPEPIFAREWYLVALKSGCVKTLAYESKPMINGLFREGWHETASHVTHWMPLPEPPKEEP